MQEAPKLQAIVRKLAERHGVDLDRPGAYLRLDLAGHGQLVIENIGARRISVVNYVQAGDVWLADPEIVVYAQHRPSKARPGTVEQKWFPIEITERYGGWRLCADLDPYGELVLYDEADQMELARYVEHVVAPNLVAHGWLEHGERSTAPVRLWTPEEIWSRDIRVDELQLPSGEEAHL
ncbi:MAG: hypothetical protein H3C34_27510 [Caldilineaceae bacterium]|nr:hypothetical protein [Caldilineaceae bacterium]